ncbi:hypothetical protein D3C85_892800 [compost metagenome]
MAEEEGLRALAQQIGTTVIGAGLGQACSVPLEEVLGTQGQFGVDGQGGGNLVARHEQLLGFGAGRGRRLGQVEGGLAVADRVRCAEHGLAPEHVVLAKLEAQQRLFADFGVVEQEGIENLAGRAAVVALGVVAQMRAAKNGRGWRVTAPSRNRRKLVVAVDERIGIGAGIVIGLVVPARGADAEAHAVLVDHVELGQQVDPVGDIGAGLAEVVVAVVAVGGAEHALVGALGAHAIVVLDGVIESDSPVFATGIQFEGMGGRQARYQDCRGQQAAPHGQDVVTLHWMMHLCFCCGLTLRTASLAPALASVAGLDNGIFSSRAASDGS